MGHIETIRQTEGEGQNHQPTSNAGYNDPRIQPTRHLDALVARYLG